MKKHSIFYLILFIFSFNYTSFAQITIETDKFKKSFSKKYDFLLEVTLELKNEKKGNFFKEISEYYYEIDKDTLGYYQVQYNLYAKTAKELENKKYTIKNLKRIYFQKVPMNALLLQGSDEKPYTFTIKEGTIKNKKEYEIIVRINPEKQYYTAELSVENNKITNIEEENDYSHFAIFFLEKNNAEKFRELLLNITR
ncbi:MAG: hypothetical protein EAZ06_05675 [Cytophagales bacterium]|nr:MAG: hypothetical protein EAY69_09905 [Cytophagales bacterium]TAH29721.1 MAG: hypothetical protein EAZ06_05675 [Cytophagales bacterium]